MKQLGHASQIIPLLHPEGGESISNEDSAAMLEVLSRQLGHSDGIRGFFAVYLTSPESLAAEEVPEVLAEAVRNADAKVLVPLACMNVIMPTAMTSIHQDEELKECAAKTAANGTKILRLLKGNEDVVNNCRAILSVCQGGEDEGSAELREVSLIATFAFPFCRNSAHCSPHLLARVISIGRSSLSTTNTEINKGKTLLWR